MKYYLKENLRLMNTDGELLNEEGKTAYLFRSSSLFGTKIELFHKEEMIGMIQSKFSLVNADYDLFFKEEKIGSLKQRLKYGSSDVEIEGLNWKIRGDLYVQNYQIIDDEDEPIAVIYQEKIDHREYMCIEINKEEKKEEILIAVLAFDLFRKQRLAAITA